MRWHLNFAITCLLSTSLAQASNVSTYQSNNYQIQGFSSDGRYLAFWQFGWGGDGDECSTAELWLINNASNSLIKRFYRVSEYCGTGRGGIVNQNKLLQQAQPWLKRFKINDQQKGKVVWNSNKLTILRHRSTSFKADLAAGQTWLFKLNQPIAAQAARNCPDTIAEKQVPRGVLLQMRPQKQNNSATPWRVLQKDGSVLPTSRACAYAYRPLEVRVQGQFLAVIIAAKIPSGFEGETTWRFMVASNKWPRYE